MKKINLLLFFTAFNTAAYACPQQADVAKSIASLNSAVDLMNSSGFNVESDGKKWSVVTFDPEVKEALNSGSASVSNSEEYGSKRCEYKTSDSSGRIILVEKGPDFMTSTK